MYERLKKYLWPHTIVPLLAMVLIDYVQLFGHLVQISMAAYLFALGLCFTVGIWLYAVEVTKKGEANPILDANLVKVLPSVKWGYDLAKWMLDPKEESPTSED